MDAHITLPKVDREITLPKLIERRANETPSATWADDVVGTSLTYGEAHEDALAWAGAFEQLGVRAGDTVVAMLAPGLDALRVWLALSWLRAVFTPINTELAGSTLVHAVTASKARILVIQNTYAPQLERVREALVDIDTIVILDSESTSDLPARIVTREELMSLRGSAATAAAPELWDISCMPFTSGTTGPSKGVLVPWGQFNYNALRTQSVDLLRPDDVFYSAFPVYHLSGLLAPYLMAYLGSRVTIRDRFSGTAFWDDIRKFGCTYTMFSGAMSYFIYRQPPQPDDADNTLRRAVMWPVIPEWQDFKARFGIDSLATAYSMTELSGPIMNRDIEDPTSCGRLIGGAPGYHVRLVDEHDQEVPVGTPGEVIVRSDEPWTMAAGYFGEPAKTADAMRNGWFHTGDMLRQDEGGNFYFVDRMKDAIRRRGELIASFDVEAQIALHPEVADVAVVGIASEWSEEEVLAVVVRVEGSTLSASELIEYITPLLPRFMVPRYVSFVDALPRTETQKVQKVILRERGIDEGTWDREKAESGNGS